MKDYIIMSDWGQFKAFNEERTPRKIAEMFLLDKVVEQGGKNCYYKILKEDNYGDGDILHQFTYDFCGKISELEIIEQ